MFTGIVQAVGELKRVTSQEGGLRLNIAPGMLDLRDVNVGDSIAINGVSRSTLWWRHVSRGVSRDTLTCTEAWITWAHFNSKKPRAFAGWASSVVARG